MGIPEIIWSALAQNSVQLALLVFTFSVAYWVVTHPEGAERWGRNILKLQALVRNRLRMLMVFLKTRIKARKDTKTINTVMGEVGKQIHSKISKARVHYVASSNVSGRVSVTQQNGVTDIFVEDSGDDNTNLLTATLAFLRVALVPNLHFLVVDLTKAMDLAIFMRMLKRLNKQGLCEVFWSSFLPETLKSLEVHDYLQKFVSMEEKGVFTGITLTELKNIDGYSYRQATLASELVKLKNEVTQLISFVEAITNKTHEELAPLEFQGTYVKVAVLLIGRTTTKLYGDQPYVNRLVKLVQKGVQRIYVMAVGEDNTKLVKDISKHDIDGAVMVTDLQVFRPAAFNFRPAIVSLFAYVTI